MFAKLIDDQSFLEGLVRLYVEIECFDTRKVWERIRGSFHKPLGYDIS